MRPEIAQSTTPNSFPSGHATIALAALFAVLMVTPRRFRPLVTIVGAGYAVFVANQTVVYGWHRVSDIIGACAIAVFWLGIVRAVGPRVDRGLRGDRDGRRGPRRVVSVVLLVVTGATLATGVVALVVGLAGDGAYDHAAILLCGAAGVQCECPGGGHRGLVPGRDAPRRAHRPDHVAVRRLTWEPSRASRPRGSTDRRARAWRECAAVRYVVPSKSMQTHRYRERRRNMQFGIFTVSDVTTDPTTGTTPDDTQASATS
ncbi:phosphatase PAP2 family protein [Curtobacterium flaccumfaciens]|nr:phosphatase PAP2 family protein [Curtobacterium flaccumfaciens]